MNGDLNSWDKFCNYLWFDKKLNIWLDISKINFTNDNINNFEKKFIDVFSSIKDLENGAISNIDENRQVGHYWLRNPSISPFKICFPNSEIALISAIISSPIFEDGEIEGFLSQ